MTAIQLRTELKAIIDKTNDVSLLEQLKRLLQRPASDQAAFVELNRMADLSERAIDRGDVLSHEEVLRTVRERRKRK